MVASRILLVLFSIALLALTSAQRVNEDDGSALQEEDALEIGDSNQQHGDIHARLNEIKKHFQDQLSQHGKEAIKSKKVKNGQRGRRSSDDDSLEVQDHQSGSERAGGGQGGRGRSELKGQNGKGSQKGKKGKGGQREQKGNGGQQKQKGKGGQKKEKGRGGQRSQQDNVQEVYQE
ncbi:ATP-dependent RNA helicase DDX42-like [Mus caroli]|uniref:ATP-dependent RNA helicase DDX42-like n=1 Tax=Mus caroli TaxID=10089 RepID=A0A6P5PZX3_MUSCR|nr:ATP-dependent RNA helicase DDX42-like [Mus caroli]